ncbi:MetQ/NlpA family ABC transporter substrate-binding protein [Thermicanus aegyptius]|uniref:MetQ/NlpA family ABC transporter substrate-binding protein n=1 Tax=Thermicanus aegyptius TaxID=94009 RepID=UPI000401CE34|nr:MetQ/NlpA family ABC transporter substrate-binding protein [Thermicanus aegyptius]
MKKGLIVILLTSILAILAGCGSQTSGKALSPDKLLVGVTAGPHEQIMEKVKEVAAKDGLNITLKVFNEYVMPNVALAEGELDVNIYQHKPFLEQMKKDRNLDLTDIAPTVNFPMGIYSKKVKDVKEIPDGGKIGLPNDPTNGARALILFQQAGLIKLKDGVGVKATVKDIQENPHNYQFVELEASQIPRQLDELDAAAINTNFAIEHGYLPSRDAIVLEPKDSPWVNVIVVRTENKDDPVLQKLIKAYHSDEVKKFIEEKFQGSVVPAW